MLRLGNRFQADEDHHPHVFVGCRFHVTKKNSDKLYVSCVEKRSISCPATGIITRANYTFRPSPKSLPHNHPPDPALQEDERFMRDLYYRATADYTPVLEIYNEILDAYPPVMRTRIPFFLVQSRMEEWRRRIPLMTNPRSYVALQEVMQLERFQNLLRHQSGTLRVTCITAADNNSVAIMGDAAFANRIPHFTRLNITSTRKVVPVIDETSQLIMLTAEYQHYAFTFGWVLVNEFSADVCSEVMAYIKRELMPDTQPALIATNLDCRMMGAAAETWENAQVRPNFHQQSMAIMHQASITEGIDIRDENHKDIIMKLMMIAGLRVNFIIDSFDVLWQKMTAPVLASFLPLLLWYRNTLIRGLTPAKFSLFREEQAFSLIDMRTSGRLLAKVKQVTPTLWGFHRKILEIAHESHDDLTRVLNATPGQDVGVSRSPNINQLIIRVGTLRRLWRLLELGVIDSSRFVDFGPGLLYKYYDIILHQQEYVHRDFEVVAGIPADEDIEYFQQPRVPRDPQGLQQFNMDHVLALRVRERRMIRRVLGPVREELQEEDVGQQQRDGNPPLPYDWRCIGCNIRPIDTIVRPCNCVVLCRECAASMRVEGQALVCPSCSNRAVSLERAYIPQDDEADRPRDVNEDPYNWLCTICESGTFISVMGSACHQIICCTDCAVRLRTGPRPHNRALACPGCNIPTSLIDVNIRRNR